MRVAGCGSCGVWGLWSVGVAECRSRGVKVRSVFCVAFVIKGGNSMSKLYERYAGLGYIRKCIKTIIF